MPSTMSRSFVAVLVFALLSVPPGAAVAVDAGPTAYELNLELSRNGQALGRGRSHSDAGVPDSLAMPTAQLGILEVHHRVSRFPGSQGQRVLVQLEIFRQKGARRVRLLAPTVGVWLGEEQVSRFQTEAGLIEIRTRVSAAAPRPAETGRRTVPADRDLDAWLAGPGRPVPLI
jgi:hypothetical protein